MAGPMTTVRRGTIKRLLPISGLGYGRGPKRQPAEGISSLTLTSSQSIPAASAAINTRASNVPDIVNSSRAILVLCAREFQYKT